MAAWSLPEYIADLLPSEARRVELMRRGLLDLFRTYGYELVMPPLLEYPESLLSGTGQNMDLQMFKLVDRISGRTMGLRPDMTPQVARIDAHLLNRQGVTRLCYCGSVVHTVPAPLTGQRELVQIGAEIYGHAGIEADLEIQRLLLEALQRCKVDNVRLDLGHAGILKAMLDGEQVNDALAELISNGLQAKDRAALNGLEGISAPLKAGLLALSELYGGPEVLVRARQQLSGFPEVNAPLSHLEAVVQRLPESLVSIDLGDSRGYRYYTGVVFSAYGGALPSAIARGGRYDRIGEAFGRARPAAGFSLYLRDVARTGQADGPSAAIRAPWSEEAGLVEAVGRLRLAGEVVIQALPGHEHEEEEFACDRELAMSDGRWIVKRLSEQQ